MSSDSEKNGSLRSCSKFGLAKIFNASITFDSNSGFFAIGGVLLDCSPAGLRVLAPVNDTILVNVRVNAKVLHDLIAGIKVNYLVHMLPKVVIPLPLHSIPIDRAIVK